MSNDNKNGNGTDRDPRLETLRELQEQDGEDRLERELSEYHLDCQGRKRLFRIHEFPTALGGGLEAIEIRDGEPTGWRLPLRFDPATEIPPYYELRTKLAERLATRDVVRDPDTGRLEILNMRVRAQVGEAEWPATGPDLLVDEDVVTWEELGELMRPFAGWGLRIQITDCGDE